MKPNEFEKELEFVANIKIMLRDMFPTIELGKGRTLANLIFHITQLKQSIILSCKKSFGPLYPFEVGVLNEPSSHESSTII